MIRSKRFPEKKDLVINGFIVKCQKCLLRLEWEQQDGTSRTIKVKPCPDCTTTVNKRVGVAELRELLLSQTRRVPRMDAEERLGVHLGRMNPALPYWEQKLNKRVSDFVYTVGELKKPYLTPQAREEIEQQMKKNREALITTVLAVGGDTLFEEEEQVERNGGDGSCNCND